MTDLLADLEEQAIFIIRECIASFSKGVILFSGGKDSTVLLHLVSKAFFPSKINFPILHIDTGYNFPEVMTFRDECSQKYQVKLITYKVEDYLPINDSNKITEVDRNFYQGKVLNQAIKDLGLECCLGGARRDEEKARAKEKIFSKRGVGGNWDPYQQSPEIEGIFHTFLKPGEHFRVFPLSNWTELDIWNYIQKEHISLPSIYFSHQRRIIKKDVGILPFSEYVSLTADDEVLNAQVRFRTVGDMSCTSPIFSQACSVSEIIEEIKASKISERGSSRLDDQKSTCAMEKRKKEGYF